MKLSVNSPCPCGSSKKFKKCCKVIHNSFNAKNALELIKSRYSAYVAKDSKYIINTTHKENKDYTQDHKSWADSIMDFSKNTQFNTLSILDFIDGEEKAFVTFNVNITQDGQDASFTEKSMFYKENGKWLYHSGEFL